MMTEGLKSSVDDSHGIKLGTHEDAYQNYHLHECWPGRCKTLRTVSRTKLVDVSGVCGQDMHG